MLTINQGPYVMPILRQLNSSTSELSRIYERLSSGSRINKASDDAAGLAVVNSLKTMQVVNDRGTKNLSDGLSALSIMDQALSELSTIVTRQKELAEQSSNGILSQEQRSALNQEAQALRNEHSRIIDTTSFNGITLLKGEGASLSLQGGIGSEATLSSKFLSQSTFSIDMYDEPYFGNAVHTTHPNLNSQTRFIVFEQYDRPILVAINLLESYQSSEAELVLATYMLNASNQFEEVSVLALSYGLDPVNDFINPDFGMTNSTSGIDVFIDDQAAGIMIDHNISISPNGELELAGPAYFPFVNESVQTLMYDFSGNGEADMFYGHDMGLMAQFNGSVTTFESLSQNSFSLATQSGALSALDSLSSDLEKLSGMRGKVGAFQSRVEVASSLLQSAREQFAAAESRIKDADMASESAGLVRFTILQQASAAVLAQANTIPALALTLLDP